MPNLNLDKLVTAENHLNQKAKYTPAHMLQTIQTNTTLNTHYFNSFNKCIVYYYTHIQSCTHILMFIQSMME